MADQQSDPMKHFSFEHPVVMASGSIDEVAAWAQDAYGPMSVRRVSDVPSFSFRQKSLSVGAIEINQLSVRSTEVDIQAGAQENYYFAVPEANYIEITLGSKRYLLKPGTLFPVNLDRDFHLRFLESPVAVVIKVPRWRMDRFLGELFPSQYSDGLLQFESRTYALDHPSARLVLSFLRTLLGAFHDHPRLAGNLLIRQTWEHQLLLILCAGLESNYQGLVERVGGEKPTPPVITRAEAYIREHLTVDFSLDDLVCASRVGRSAFLQAFRVHKGASPMALTNMLRLEKARQYLFNPAFDDLSIAQIAETVCYGDPAYFARRYRLKYKETPSETRRRKKD